MAVGHLDTDSLRSILGMQYRMPVRRRYSCSGRARPRDRSATARPFALDSRPTGLLHSLADGRVGKGNGRSDEFVASEARAWRFPIAFGNDKLHGLKRFLRCASIPLDPRLAGLLHVHQHAAQDLARGRLGDLVNELEMP